MKYIRLIGLFILTHSFVQPSDAEIIGYYTDEISEPNTKIIYRITKKEVPDQELSRKVDPETGRIIIHRLTSNPHYKPKAIPAEPDFSNVKFGTLKTRDDYQDSELKEREEKLKKLRQQEKAAKKIQDKWRSRKKLMPTETSANSLDQALSKNNHDENHKNNVKWNKIHLIIKIEDFADQSYPKFKELICTSDYLTKTDWIYQFIEATEDKTIFERNLDGTINPEKFTPEFEQKISNPTDWLDDAIIKYLPKFHDIVYEAFIDKAVEQIKRYKTSWTDAVSISAPKDHGSFQEESTPLFPKVYQPHYSSDNKLILGKIFTKILQNDPKKFEQLHLQDLVRFHFSHIDRYDNDNRIYDACVFDNILHTNISISAENLFVNNSFNENAGLQTTLKNSKNFLSERLIDSFNQVFEKYLTDLGLELSPEEQKQLDEDLKYPDLSDQWQRTTESYEEYLERNEAFNKNFIAIELARKKFIEDHINWASSARQTFFLGQLIFDKSLPAFEALGGQQWLSKQPKDMQEYITKFIDKIKNKRLKRMKKEMQNQSRNLYRDLSSSQ